MAVNADFHAIDTWRLCRWALRYAFHRWPGVLAVLLVSLCGVGLQVLQPWPMQVLVDYVLNGRPIPTAVARFVAFLPGSASREALLLWCVAAWVVLFLLGWAIGVAGTYANISFGQRMTYDVATDLFRHLQRLSLRFHSRRSVGDTMRRITEDCGCVSTIVDGALLPVATSVLTLGAMFGVMWRLDPLLTLLSLVIVPYMVFVFRRYAQPMLQRSYRHGEAEGELYAVVEQTMSAMPVVQAFSREERENRRFAEQANAVLRTIIASTSVDLQFRILMGLATAAGTAGIIWIGATHALQGKLTVGTILVFLSYLGSLYGPLEALMYTASTVQGAAGSAHRVLEVLESDPEVQDRPGAVLLPPVRGHVRLEGVTFGYDPERPVLHDVSLEAFPGETLALVGQTGAGKSTLVSLLPRFFDPQQGRVLIDGHDLREVQLKSVREQVALVLQEPFLFPFSVAENIAYGRPEATREEVEAAAKAANAHAFIERLPEGYDTVIGERGATLSGGERQRLAIARALLKDAPILILDEPTSALDAETESLLLEALERLMAGRTTFIIAHRLSTIRKADRVVVIHDGRVIESGTHRELLAHNGRFARLHSLQFGEPDRPVEVTSR